MKIFATTASRGVFLVEASADELARCLAFEDNGSRLKSPGQYPFRVGDIVLVEIHSQGETEP